MCIERRIFCVTAMSKALKKLNKERFFLKKNALAFSVYKATEQIEGKIIEIWKDFCAENCFLNVLKFWLHLIETEIGNCRQYFVGVICSRKTT